MAKKATAGSAKRFGPRYGARNRERLANIEKEHRGRLKCPFCNFTKVRRVSKGIWKCEKCNETFTGKAYSFEAKKRKSADLLRKPKKEKPREEEYEDMEALAAAEEEEKKVVGGGIGSDDDSENIDEGAETELPSDATPEDTEKPLDEGEEVAV